MAATVKYSNEKSSFLSINEECMYILGIVNSDQISNELIEVTYDGKSYIYPIKVFISFASVPYYKPKQLPNVTNIDYDICLAQLIQEFGFN